MKYITTFAFRSTALIYLAAGKATEMLPLFWFVLLGKLARLNIFALCLGTDLSFMSCTLESLHCFNIPRVTWSSLKLRRVSRAGNIYSLLQREKSKVLAVSLSFPQSCPHLAKPGLEPKCCFQGTGIFLAWKGPYLIFKTRHK